MSKRPHDTDGDEPIPAIFATIHHQSDDRPDGYSAEDIAELNRAANSGPPTRSRKPLLITAGSVALIMATGVAASWLSPRWTIAQITSAAHDSDGSRLEMLIDFPAVRTSLEADLKDMMGAAYRQEIAASGDEMAMLFSGVGAGIVDSVATDLAQQAATPATLEKAIRGDDVWVNVLGEPRNIALEFRPQDAAGSGLTTKGRYLSWSRYEYRIAAGDSNQALRIQMERTGLFSWRVDRLRLDTTFMDAFDRSATTTNDAPLPVEKAEQADPPPAFSDQELYAAYRASLLNQGFVPVPQHRSGGEMFCGTEYLDPGEPDLCVAYPEVEECGGTGSRPCLFVFERSADGRQLAVSTEGELFDRLTVTATKWKY